jgi:hypothetical protein
VIRKTVGGNEFSGQGCGGRKLNLRNAGAGLVLAGLISCVPAGAAGISYTCAANLETTTCNYLNTTIAGLYAGVFQNANASIYIQYGSTGLGSSVQFYNSTTYNNYLSALTTHEGDPTDAGAVATLPTTEPSVFGGNNVYLTSALSQALGIPNALTFGDGITSSLQECLLGTTGCYNGVITVANNQPLYYRVGNQASNQYDIYAVIEHETDEILGTPSCITTIGGQPDTACNGGPSPADLFRYSSAGVRSFISQGNGTSAYFSINGGVTNIASYNNSPNGGDYGDWSTTCAHVQDAYGCPGLSMDITNDGRVEISVLSAVGYNQVASTPEPGTIGMLALGVLAFTGYQRRRKI